MVDQLLAGCRVEPLGSYLKGVGVLRLVAEQADPEARGTWQGDEFVLSTRLEAEELLDFFFHDWRPTPLVSPWNKGAGFDAGGKSPAAVRALGAVEASGTSRLKPYRDTIVVARQVGGMALTTEEVVQICRARLPDAALAWLDAAIVLTGGRPAFAPILGTGGNLGRQELSVNFMQHVIEVIALEDGSDQPGASASWLRSSLFAGEQVALCRAPTGQYDPGRAGGVNSSPLGDGGSLVNPWDFVLALEGAVAFASAAARRLGAESGGTAAMPFTVGATPVGYADACSAKGDRYELWAPLWGRPATWPEVSRLLGEGRAQWGRRQSTSGLDFVRATASLGIDRGVDRFVRHAIVQRFGQSMLALPVGRIDVRAKPGVPALQALDGWVNQLARADDPPAAISSALHRLEAAQFQMAMRGGGRRLQEVLVALADLEGVAAQATTFRARAGVKPVGGLPAPEWLPALAADGGSSVELRLAACLASLHDGRRPGVAPGRAGSLALLLRPVQLDERRRLDWASGGAPVPGMARRPVVDLLADAHRQRAVRVVQAGEDEPEGDRHPVGVQSAFTVGLTAAREDAARLVDGSVNDEHLRDLLAGLLLLDWSGALPPRWALPPEPWTRPMEPAWAVLAPFFEARQNLLRPQAGWVARLGAGQVTGVLKAALLRLHGLEQREVVVVNARVMASGTQGKRLASALLLRLTHGAYAALLDQVAPRLTDGYNPAESLLVAVTQKGTSIS